MGTRSRVRRRLLQDALPVLAVPQYLLPLTEEEQEAVEKAEDCQEHGSSLIEAQVARQAEIPPQVYFPWSPRLFHGVFCTFQSLDMMDVFGYNDYGGRGRSSRSSLARNTLPKFALGNRKVTFLEKGNLP